MKTKPVIITLICIILLVCLGFFIKFKYLAKPEKADITKFLNDFNLELKSGHVDTLLSFFENGRSNKTTLTLIKVLVGQTGLNGKTAPIFSVALDFGNSKIVSSTSKATIVDIPVSFTRDSMDTETSVITFIIHKAADHQFKIVAVKTAVFLKGYIAYANEVRNKIMRETTTFSPITLAAFKTAETLKAKYDDVLWFDHINNKTWFYVIKGKLNDDFYQTDAKKADYKPTYKMGLVNPDLKEIIPAEYDLIHNINGTIPGYIEVEKDGKKGFYNLNGKLVLPVNYDQIFPLNDDENLALLRTGDDYFYLKKDSTITEKLPDFNIADVLPKIKKFNDSYTLSDESSRDVMEYNDRTDLTSLIVAPSYLVDLGMLDQFVNFKNPLRKRGDNEDLEANGSIEIKYKGNKEDESNWFESVFYSLYDNYLGGRSGLYITKHVLMVDKKQNRILAFKADSYDGIGEGGGELSGKCNENSLRAVNDSLFEFRTTTEVDQMMLKDTMDEAPNYHYLHVVNGKLVALPNERIFGCTKYIKLDDNYMQGCFVVNGQQVDHITPAILEYMKNEIYASYRYKFKNTAWNDAFEGRFNTADDKMNTSVDDSLTVIDKYNINWINEKLNLKKTSTLAAE